MNLPAKLFSKSQILSIQKALIERFGGSHGILSEHMLESAMAAIEMALNHRDMSICKISSETPK